ncbi:prealbumin-like fold domain-containing protein [Leucobacter sp. HY1910]
MRARAGAVGAARAVRAAIALGLVLGLAVPATVLDGTTAARAEAGAEVGTDAPAPGTDPEQGTSDDAADGRESDDTRDAGAGAGADADDDASNEGEESSGSSELAGREGPAARDSGISPMAIDDFCQASPNSYYALDRPTSGGAIIRKLSFNDSTSTVNPANPTRFPASGSLSLTDGGSVNALGVSRNGVFYFTAQRTNSNGTGTAYADVYRYELDPTPTQNQLTRVVTRFPLDWPTTTVHTIVAGAVNPGDGSFYWGYYGQGTGSGSGANRNIALHLFRFAPGSTARKIAVVDIKNPSPGSLNVSPGSLNGDFAFDGDGNLLLTVSNDSIARTAVVTHQDIEQAIAQTDEPRALNATAGITNLTPPSNKAMNGIAFTGNGKLILEQDNMQRMVNPFTFGVLGGTTTPNNVTGNLIDLASCMTPPTLTVKKNVIDRANNADQFRLSALYEPGAGQVSLGTATTTGTATGLQNEIVGPEPVLSEATYRVREEWLPVSQAALYDHTLECSSPTGTESITTTPVPGTPGAYDFVFPASLYTDGHAVTCVFTNEAKKPKLEISKSADPESGSKVTAGQTVSYKLTFDNTKGTLDAPIDHIDHLSDVLDDANYVADSLRYGDGTETGLPANQTAPLSPGVTADVQLANERIAITGKVPAGKTRTVWFSVTVKANSDAAGDRRDDDTGTSAGATTGYLLRNFLTEKGEEPPAECETDDPTCTDHPVPSWSIHKQSQPQDGAWLHTGGNVYYQVVATATNSEGLEDVVITDDISEVMAVAYWDPQAPTLVPAVHGIRLLDAQGNLLHPDGSIKEGPAPGPGGGHPQTLSYDGSYVPVPSHTEDPAHPGDPRYGSWSLTTLPFDMPQNAVRADVNYAVKVGHPADPQNPHNKWQEDGHDVAAEPLAIFNNYATGQSETVEPNECITGKPDTFTEDCETMHRLMDSYFHVQKNSTGSDPNDPNSVEWNLADATFEIRDVLASGAMSENPSQYLCRTEYNPGPPSQTPPLWQGSWITGGTPDWNRYAPGYANTLEAISQWNAANDGYVPMCGEWFAHIDNSDGQRAGSWHANNLPEGDYYLLETGAPTGHQLLAEPIKFRVGSEDPNDPTGLGGGKLGIYDPAGTNGEFLPRCENPNQPPKTGQPACVMQTGWLMQVYDPKLLPLPMAGTVFGPQLVWGALLLTACGIVGARFAHRRRTSGHHRPGMHHRPGAH